MDVFSMPYSSPVGDLTLCSSATHITALKPQLSGAAPSHTPPILLAARDWLDTYFAGDPLPIEQLPLMPAGTPFQQTVWSLLLQIPYGQTVTYGALAAAAAVRLGKERMSAQAIGQAVGANPIAILIPCHRVVGIGGKLTGYAWGLDIKKRLLHHEGISFK